MLLTNPSGCVRAKLIKPLVQHQNPEFTVESRWWVNEADVHRVLGDRDITKIIAFKNVTSPTNQRTMIAAFIPYAGVVHSSPLIFTGCDINARLTACLLGNLNSFAYDYICRQKIGGVNLSYFIIEQIPTFHPDFYKQKCPWGKKQSLEKWISDRVLKLTCTSNDMIPLAEAAGFKAKVRIIVFFFLSESIGYSPNFCSYPALRIGS